MIVKSLTAKLQNKFHVSVAKVDEQETHQIIVIGVAAIVPHKKLTQKAREDAAKERIFSLLPGDQKEELSVLFDEFENCKTAEARFARAMDNLQPILLNSSNGGSDWKEHGISASQVYGRQSRSRMGSETLYQVIDAIIQENIRKGSLKE